MKKSYAKKLGLCVALALSAGILLPCGVVQAKEYTEPITGVEGTDNTRNQYKGETTASDPSHFTKVTDTSVKTGNVTISSFAGDALIRYAHDASMPTTIYGGNVTIGAAEDKSAITLITDGSDIDTSDTSLVSSVLGELQKKLIYTGNDSHLLSTAKISEGLTSTSAVMKLNAIQRSTPVLQDAEGDWKIYDNVVLDAYSFDDFWQSEGIEVYDEESGTRTYTFNQNVKLSSNMNVGIEKVMWWSSDPTSKAILDMNGHDLFVTSPNTKDNLRIDFRGDDGHIDVDIKNFGTFTIEGDSIFHSKDAGLVTLYDEVNFHVFNSDPKSLFKLNVTGKTGGFGIYNNSAQMIVDGLMEINNLEHAIYTDGENAQITIGGGKFNAVQDVIEAKSKNGLIDIGVKKDANGKVIGASTYDTTLQGDIRNEAEGSVFNIGLGTADSSWTGQSINSADALNLYMAKGSTWTNTGDSAMNRLQADKGRIIMEKDASTSIASFGGSANVYYQLDGKDLVGGDTKIASADAGSSIYMVADADGADLSSDDYSTILTALAKKLYYTAGDSNLTGYAKISEGLTSASAVKALGGIGFDENGQGSLSWATADSQNQSIFTSAITGDFDDDINYVKAGVRDLATGVYTFDKNETTITAENHTVSGGPYVGTVGSAVAGINDTTTLDLKNHKLTIREANKGHSTGITAIGTTGKVEINNAGAIDISATGTGQTAALFANGGGQILIHNGDDDSAVLSLRADASSKANGAVIKTMNGVSNGKSQITIDGMVDVVADGKNSNEAISAVASTIDIGGGTITAEDGAAWAIRAYGEFVSQNIGTVNVNVKKDNDGNAIGAGTRKTQITGNLGTAGGMGNKGQINIGLSGADSFLKGDYTTTANSQVGANTNTATGLNLYLSNGADWTGSTAGSTSLTMANNTTWHGSSTSKELAVNMKGAATWYNEGDSTVKYWTSQRSASQAGTIDMTETKAGDVTIDNYSGNTFVIYGHNATDPSKLTGGNITIGHADAGSSITMSTDNTGIDTENLYAVDKVLTALAEKLYYTGYIGKAEDNLKGYVQIAEGLTARSVAKAAGNIAFSEETGQGSFQKDSLSPSITYPTEQGSTEFTEAITGNKEKDTQYLKQGILNADSGEYTFTKEKNTITVGKNEIAGGPWLGKVSAAVSGGQGEKTTINMNRNELDINETNTSGAATGISAIGLGSAKPESQGTVTIKNAGNMTITARGSSVTAGLFANGSGAIYIDNAGKDANGNDYVLKIDGKSKSKASGVGIKTMNGAVGNSNITITGLVDVIADGKADDEGYAANEAVSAVASTIDIGGGNIQAINGAWAAIRAYGEFVTQNTGTVYVNVLRDEEGNMTGAGNYKTTIVGDLVTNGGMGTKGQINVGLNGKDSYWEGNYADTRGYGVTPGQLGAVNLFMKNGAHWKGFANGSVNIQMEGKDTYWYGFATSANSQLTLKDGATWINAITPEQTDQKENTVDSHIGYLTSENGIIDMTGRKLFLADSKSLSGSSTQGASSAITESENGITGNLVVDNYSGSSTILYRRDTDTPTDVLGGTVTINKAAEGSTINLRTDAAGLDYHDSDTLMTTLKNLAAKLYYTEEAADESETETQALDAEGDTTTTKKLAKNLSGTVGITEGLTQSSAALKLTDITFNENAGEKFGEGQLAKDDITSIKTPDPEILYGDKETAMIRGVKSAMTTSMLTMRSDMADMGTRLGDLHYGAEDGIWARTFGGKVKYDKDKTKITNNFWGAQIGADKLLANGWHLGGAFDYNKGNAKYELGGEGDPKLYTFSIYGTKLFDDGQYVDIAIKGGHVSNDYKVYNDSGYKLDGDYSANGFGISAEYGKRFGGEKGYIEPQMQLTLSRLGSADYDAYSNYAGGRKMHISQDGMTSFIGRLGVAAGKANDNGNFYLKASLLHEFNGKTSSTFSAEKEATTTVDQDFGDTWAELALGGTYRLSPSSMLYADITKSFGGDYEVQWKANVGVRFTF